jgi:hypothetical protein
MAWKWIACASVAFVVSASPAMSQTRPTTGSSQPPTSEAGCGQPPFAVGNRVIGGEVLAQIADREIRGVPNLSARAGAEVMRSAYAGIANQALVRLLGWYQTCKLEPHLRSQNPADLDRQLADLAAAFDELTGVIADTSNASTGTPTEFRDYTRDLRRARRAPGAFTLAPAQFDQIMRGLDPEALWIRETTLQGWIGVDLEAVTISACGGVVRAAISDGGSSLQAALGDVQPILRLYFDPQRHPSTAYLRLANHMSGNPFSRQTREPPSFRGCTAALAAETAGQSSSQPRATTAGSEPTTAPPVSQTPPTGPTTPPSATSATPQAGS